MRVFMITIVSFIFIMELKEIFSDDVIMQKSFYDAEMEPIQEQRRKKPFCNAFTGCGRKRSDDSMANMDVLAGLTIEDLSRSVKLWEVLQAFIQKQKEQRAVSRGTLDTIFKSGRKRCRFGNYVC